MIEVGFLPVALLGALLGLDVVSFPQAMISRPIVAATLGGALVGDAPGGLLVGATLELVALETLPVGASRYPEWGSAAVVGGALFASQAGRPAGALVLAVLAGLATAWIGGWTMYVLRRLNGVMARRRIPALDAGSRDALHGLHLLGMTADLGRGALLTLAALLVFHPIVRASLALWSSDPRLSRAVVVGAAASVAGGAAWKLLHGTSGAHTLFLGGLAIGLATLLVR